MKTSDVHAKEYRKMGKYHTVLPREGQDILKEAAAVKLPDERTKAIERAIALVHTYYPQLFRTHRQ